MAHENSKDSPSGVNEDTEFDSLDDLPPSDTDLPQRTEGELNPDEEESEPETTPIEEIIDAEAFDDLDGLADTMPMPPREELGESSDRSAVSSANENANEKERGDEEVEEDNAETESAADESEEREDAIPVPTLNRISNSVSRLREAREAEANQSPETSDEIELSTEEGDDQADEEAAPIESKEEPEEKADSKKKSKAEKDAKKAKVNNEVEPGSEDELVELELEKEVGLESEDESVELELEKEVGLESEDESVELELEKEVGPESEDESVELELEKEVEPESEDESVELESEESTAVQEEPVEVASEKTPPAVEEIESAELDDDEEGSENPISEAMRKASTGKNAPVESDGPVFLVDEDADRWIEEDIADASGPLTGVPVVPQKTANTRRGKRKTGVFGKVAMLFFVCFLLLTAAAVGAWFSRGHLIAKGESFAIKKLEEQGLFLKYESRSFEFPRGLILSDVMIFEDQAREIPKLKIGNFGIDLDVRHILSTRSIGDFEAVITMEDATAIPFQEGQEVCQITGINADLFATGERLKINRLRGTLNGLDFDVEGLVNLPEREDAEPEETASADALAENDTEGPVLDFEFLKPAIEPIAFEAAESGENPVLRIKVDLTPDLMLYADGQFSGTSFKWQGIPLDHAGITFNYSQKLNVVDVIDAQIGFGGGTITAKTQVLIDQNKLGNLALTSNVDLIKLASYFNPNIRKSLGGIELIDNPLIEANGSYDFNDPLASNLTFDYQHWKGISIPVGENFLPISGLNGQIELRDGTLRTTPTSRLRAEVLGGDVEIKGGFQPQDDPIVFTGTFATSRLPVEKLAVLAGRTDGGMTGLLSADYRGKFSSGDLSKINGSGDILIDGGKLYSIPVISEIQKRLASAIPIFGNRERSALKAHFDVMTGIFITNDLEIRSDATRLKVGGKYNLNDQTTAFKAKASLDGPLGIAAGLPKEMQLIVEGSGPVANPEIKLSGLPEGIGGILNEILGSGEPEAPAEDPNTESPAPEAPPATEAAPAPVVPEIVPIPEIPAAGPPGPPPSGE